MSAVDSLLRADLRDFTGYRTARSDEAHGAIWLNANESPLPSVADAAGALRRYPDPQPLDLRQALAALYRVPASRVLATRGSDEGIDLLVRAFCMPGQGAVVVAPPTFGMYAVSARLHGARVVAVPARDDGEGWRSNLEAMADAALREAATLVFVCSPGNPTGEAVPGTGIEWLARRLRGHALVVVDAAYAEYADADDGVGLLAGNPNLVILRTLSKAHALAGARVGCMLAAHDVIESVRRCQAPYPLPQPAVAAALAALQPAAVAEALRTTAQVRRQRERVRVALGTMPGIRGVRPSQGNFLLVRFEHPQVAYDALLAAGVVVRDLRAMAGLEDALRISIGTAAQNTTLLAALADARQPA